MSAFRMSRLVIGWLGCAACIPETPVRALTPQAEQVRVERAEPPAGAQLVGPISATDGSGCGIGGDRGTLANATGSLKEAAAHQGIDFVKLRKVTKPYSGHDCYHLEYTLEGLGYRLLGSAPRVPGAPVTASASTAAAPSAAANTSQPAGCLPPCSPGYACQAGVCLALCNPACAAQQTCRADRVCVPVGP